MSPTVAEIRRTAEARLRELEPLLAEAAKLRTLLAALDDTVAAEPEPALTPAAPATAPRTRRPARPARRRTASRRSGRDGRAPQGANKRTILDAVARRPGLAAPQIAAATGLKRTVVASTISRLKRTGELEAHGSGVRLAAAVQRA